MILLHNHYNPIREGMLVSSVCCFVALGDAGSVLCIVTKSLLMSIAVVFPARQLKTRSNRMDIKVTIDRCDY